MAEILIPSKKDIKGAITYDDINIAGRDFTPGATIKVYFMPTTAMENGAQVPYKPYTDAQVAADNTLAEVNASYQAIDPSRYQAILDNVFGPWAKLANITFQTTTNPSEAQIRVGVGTWQ